MDSNNPGGARTLAPTELVTPLLVPAWPSVMRAGLPCVVDGEAWVYVGTPMDGVRQFARSSPGAILPSRMVADESVAVRLDLRDPAVRDAVVRAMWAQLRPDEPELLTAPEFFGGYSDGWRWGLDAGQRGPRWCATPCWMRPDRVVLPVLASVPLDSPDRDLLVLAACAAAVLS